MSKRLFEIYVTVCDKGSMTAAAEELEMSQPAVSSAVAQLEKTYDTHLFERRGKTIELTESGRRLRQYASTILDQYDQAWNAMHDEEHISRYNIGITPSASDTVLAGLAKISGPERFRWHTAPSAELIEMVKEHRLDFCIADRNAEETNLTYLPLNKEEFSCVTSMSYYDEDTASPAELAAMDLLLREPGSGSRECLEAALTRRSLAAVPYIQSSSDLTLIRLAENGLGAAVVPERLVQKSLRKKRLHAIKIKGADMRRQYYLICRSDMYMDESLQTWIREIRTAAKKGAI